MYPRAYLEGLRLFNEGSFWDAHEAWEDVWRLHEKGSSERLFYQGLIQLAAAFLHRERAKASPALRCYRSGVEKLEQVPDTFLGMDVAAVRGAARDCFEPLEGGADPSSLPPPFRLEVEGA